MSISWSSPRCTEAKSPAATTTSAPAAISANRAACRSSRCRSLKASSRISAAMPGADLPYAQSGVEVRLLRSVGCVYLRLLDLSQHVGRDSEERLDQFGVEVPSALALDLRERLLRRPRRLVRTLGAQGVEHVADRADPARERDLVAVEAEGVAGPVPVLVMGQGDRL